MVYKKLDILCGYCLLIFVFCNFLGIICYLNMMEKMLEKILEVERRKVVKGFVWLGLGWIFCWFV